MSEAATNEPPAHWVAGVRLADQQRVGNRLAYLASQMPKWITRRVESIEFHDDTYVRRRVSVDFTLPEEVTPLPLVSGERVIFVPLTYIDKGPLRNFDLRDEGGVALPLLTRTENGELAAAALRSVAAAVLGKQPLETEVLADLNLLAYESNQPGDRLLNSLFRRQGDARLTRYLLEQDPVFSGQARRLASAFLLIVPLADTSRRRIIKFAFDEPLGNKSRKMSHRFAESLSWRATRITVEVPGVPLAASCHVEAQAPAELTLTHAELALRNSRIVVDEDSGPRPSIHLMSRAYVEPARAVLRLMPPRGGIIRTSFLTALLTAAVLTGGAFRLKELDVDKEGVATVLVSVPALIAVYIARPGEHALASRLLFGVRGCVLLSGVVSFAASALLLAGPHRHAREVIWWSLDGLAILMALMLLGSLMRSRKPSKKAVLTEQSATLIQR